jgi:hypothetical protein
MGLSSPRSRVQIPAGALYFLKGTHYQLYFLLVKRNIKNEKSKQYYYQPNNAEMIKKEGYGLELNPLK